MKRDRVICIMGRTGSGKDTLINSIKHLFGNKFQLVTSFSTRKQRPGEPDDSHIFITEEEYNIIPDEQKIAETTINGCHYCATYDQLDDIILSHQIPIYIIDFDGYHMLKTKEKYDLKCIYIYATLDTRRERFASRQLAHISEDQDKLDVIQQFMDRDTSEKDQFNYVEAFHHYDILFNNDKNYDRNSEEWQELIETFRTIILKSWWTHSNQCDKLVNFVNNQSLTKEEEEFMKNTKFNFDTNKLDDIPFED